MLRATRHAVAPPAMPTPISPINSARITAAFRCFARATTPDATLPRRRQPEVFQQLSTSRVHDDKVSQIFFRKCRPQRRRHAAEAATRLRAKARPMLCCYSRRAYEARRTAVRVRASETAAQPDAAESGIAAEQVMLPQS